MSIRETLAARPKPGEIVKRPIRGLGDISIRIMSTREALALVGKPETGLEQIRFSLVDEEGKPLFNSLEEIRQLDWALTQELMQAVNAIDGFKLDDAKKN